MCRPAIIALFSLFLGWASAWGQSSTAARSLSLDVRPTSSGGTTKNKGEVAIHEGNRMSGFYQHRNEKISTTRQKGSGSGIAIEVRNLGQQPAGATVEWYFVGKPVEGGNPFIFDEGSKQVMVPNATNHTLEVKSAEISSKVEKKLTLRSGYREPQDNLPTASVKRSGSKIVGWMVRLVAGGQLVEVQASTPSLEAVARDSAQLNGFPRRLVKEK